MAAKKDFYEVLGISKSANSEEIKKAYRKQALQWHPDRHTQDKKVAEEKFKEINEAYQVLSDSQKKSAYDQFGHSAFEQGGMGAGGQGPFGGQGFGGQGPFTYTYYSSGGQGNEYDFSGFSDPFEIFEQFFGGASPFGSRQRGSRRKVYKLEITFLEAVKGVEKEIEVEGKRTKIKIPAGVDTGSRIRFSDFDLVLEVGSDRKFKREGDDLILEQTISLSDAILGGVLDVETIDGREKIKIHSGTQPGTIVRLRGKGVLHVRGGGRGDMYLKLNIRIPDKITSRQKELIKEFEADKNKTRWF